MWEQAEARGGQAPPAGNTGALPTCGEDRVLVDWVGVTFHRLGLGEVLELLGGEWADLGHGGMGYRRAVGRAGGAIRVLWDGAEGMGVHVEITGQGCRQLEAEGVVDWAAWLRAVLAAGGEVSRLDVAADVRTSAVGTVEQLERAVDEGLVVSRWRGARVERDVDLRNGQERGKTVYLGAGSSLVKLRVYDKAAEQGLPGPWTRWELQARDERAQVLAAQVVARGLVQAFAGVLGWYVEVKERGADGNRWRWPTAAWWLAFLGLVERVRLTMAKAQRTVEDVREWVRRQVAPSLALLVMAEQGSVDGIHRLVAEGMGRLRAHHRALLAGSGG